MAGLAASDAREDFAVAARACLGSCPLILAVFASPTIREEASSVWMVGYLVKLGQEMAPQAIASRTRRAQLANPGLPKDFSSWCVLHSLDLGRDSVRVRHLAALAPIDFILRQIGANVIYFHLIRRNSHA